MFCCRNTSLIDTLIASHITSLLCLYLRASTKHNRAKCNTYVNNVNVEFNAEPFDSRKETNILVRQTFMMRTFRFSFWNQGILCSSIVITFGKTPIVKDLSKPEI